MVLSSFLGFVAGANVTILIKRCLILSKNSFLRFFARYCSNFASIYLVFASDALKNNGICSVRLRFLMEFLMFCIWMCAQHTYTIYIFCSTKTNQMFFLKLTDRQALTDGLQRHLLVECRSSQKISILKY